MHFQTNWISYILNWDVRFLCCLWRRFYVLLFELLLTTPRLIEELPLQRKLNWSWRSPTKNSSLIQTVIGFIFVEIYAPELIFLLLFSLESAFAWEMKTKPSIAQNITTTRNQTAAISCHTYIAPLTLERRSVSYIWRLRLRTSVRLVCQFECRSHQARRWLTFIYIFTRGQFWPSGIVVVCVCLSVCPSDRPSLCAVITCLSAW